jgi:hypothetical protein
VTIELPTDLVGLLTSMQTTLNDLRSEVRALRANLQSKPAAPPDPREWYSVDEAAGMLGKRPYTVREWARLGQVNAVKRAERRGRAALWSISADELSRYRNHGLLPIDQDRNNLN